MVRSSLQLAAVLAVLVSAPACDLSDDKKEGAQEEPAENTREAKVREAPRVWPDAGPASYHVSLVTSLRSGAAPVTQKMTVQGFLSLQRSNKDGAERLLARLDSVEVLDRRGKPLDEARVLAEDLQLPFGMVTDGGLARQFLHDSRATENAYGITSQLLAALQISGERLVAPKPVTEWDATGEAKVRYAPDGEHKFSFEKLEYVRVTASQSGSHANARRKVSPRIVSSKGSVALDAQGLSLVERTESISVTVAEQSTIDTSLELTMKRVKAQPGEPLPSWDEFASKARKADVGDAFTWAGGQLLSDLKRGDLSLDQVFEILGQSATAAPNQGQRSSAFRALVSMLRDEPPALKRTVEELGRGTDPVTESSLLDALGAASTPATLRVLASSIQSKKLTKQQRARAASSMIRAQWPTREAFEALKPLVDDPAFREHGLMGIGTFVRRWRDAHERDLMLEGIEVLRTELKQSTAKESPVPVLLGVANSGAVELYDLVLPYQDSDKKDVRDAAIQSVRLMKDPRVEKRLASFLEGDKAEDIRSALHALRPRDPTSDALVQSVRDLAEGHSDPHVRREAVLVLKSWSNERMELTGVLASLKSSEKDNQVLRALQ